MQDSNRTAAAGSDLAWFVKSLAEEGRAIVSPAPLPSEAGNALVALRQLDEIARRELALELPSFAPEPALWAARLFYQLCQFAVCRDISEARIIEACETPAPEPRSPEVDWSVDLTLRHLPRLFNFARQLSHADPLLQQMKRIGAAWPLSSVGMPELDEVQLELFAEHAALLRVYSDRVIAAGDVARTSAPGLRDLLRSDLGPHHELAPAIAAKLFAASP